MRTWQPRRDRAGNNAEKPRPDQPSSQDATRTTVHDRRKPSRAEPDARCRQPFAAQAFAAGAPARVCSCRRTQEDQTMARRKPRPCQKRQVPEAQDEAHCLAHAGTEEKHTKASTQTLCGERSGAPGHAHETLSGGAVHHVQHVDKQQDSLQ